MKLTFFPLFFILFSVFCAQAQEKWKNIDYVYQENIRTITFLPDETAATTTRNSVTRLRSQTTISTLGLRADSIKQRNLISILPIVQMGRGITLSFDDLDGDFKYYRYKLEYCNADWTPTELTELDYIVGYHEDRLPDGKNSFGVNSPYTNYRLSLPNQNTKWTKSGNYLLHIYLDEEEDVPILTRRFCVFEDVVKIQAKMTRTLAEKNDTHQEFDFEAKYQNLKVRNPQREFQAIVLQNGRWDNAKYKIRPNYYLPEVISFDYQDSIVFEAGKEFRPLDLRSVNFERGMIQMIESYQDGYDITLFTDKSRENIPYQFIFDLNGGFIVDNKDLVAALDIEQQCEYPHVLFSLPRNEPFADSDVYVIGKLNDWNPTERFKMTYNIKRKEYLLDVPIKQGYYDYAYAVIGKDKKINMSDIDGNWYETENNYTILLYFRAVGDRFDRLIGVKSINSLFDR